MKITAFFCICFLSFLQVKATGQLYSVSVYGVDFEQFIRQIEQQTGYQFVYVKSDIPTDARITLDMKNVRLDEILRNALEGYRLSYVIKDKMVVLSKSQKLSYRSADFESAPDENIRGLVLDENRNPLAGAEVRWKGTNSAVITGADGRFLLKKMKGAGIIRVSYIGYTVHEAAAESGKFMSLRMSPSGGELDKVEIIAYGTTTRRLSTSNTTSVGAADIERQPVPNPLLALQGRVPGLLITQGSGNPGATVTVRIQGTNSLIGSNDPFYVVDGVPFTSSLLSTGGNTAVWGESAGAPGRPGFAPTTLENPGSGNPFSYLNPADIESIEILKDADATAIYGSRAGNGAILITTKRGKSGALSVDLNLKSGWSKITRRVKLLNTQQYLQMRREAIANSNFSIGRTAYDMNGAWDTTRYTDWQEEFLRNSAKYFDGQVSVSGGNANTNFLMGLGFHKETTLLPSDFSDKKFSGHFSLRSSSNNQKFKLNLSTNYLIDNNRLPATNVTTQLLYLPPHAPTLRNVDGSVNWAIESTGLATLAGRNPFADLSNRFNSNTSNFISNLTLSYLPLPGLEIKTSLGYTRFYSDQVITSSSAAVAPPERPGFNRSATFAFNTMESYILEPQATYRLHFDRHKIDILAGGTIQRNANDGKSILAEGQNSDAQLFNFSAAGKLTGTASNTLYKYVAGFGRLGYNYDDKYLLNLTVRRDGSTRFGPASRFQNFGAVGAAWVLSKEAFVHLPSAINFLKLKFSYGTTGNDRVGDYSFMDLYQLFTVNVPYQGVTALTPTALVNNSLQWELIKKMNIGIDVGLMQDRLLFGINYARNRSSNLLQNFQLPLTAGFNTVLRNFPGMVENTSLEVTANVNILRTSNIKWSANVNFTVPRNKLVSLPDLDKLSSAPSFGYVVGKPLGVFSLYKYAGIDPQTGVALVEDAKGNVTATPSDEDFKELMDLSSPVYAGMSQSFSYKALRLDFMFQFVKQKAKRYNQALVGSPVGTENINQPELVMERWQKPGDLTNTPKFQASGNTGVFDRSDISYEDASFVRVKNIALSAEIPSAWITKIKVKSCRIAAQVQNLFTFTRYSGLDPETGIAALPPFRTIVLGLQVGF